MPGDTQTPEGPTNQTPEQVPDEIGAVSIIEHRQSVTVAATGRRQAFRDIRRQLQEADLNSPGVQKLLLEELETVDARCDVLEGYIERFHEADKRAAVLEEKLTLQTAFEILFAVGVGLGCAIMGLAPFFWETGKGRGPAVLVVGAVLVAGSAAARIVRK